jgi:hypothetical protein
MSSKLAVTPKFSNAGRLPYRATDISIIAGMLSKSPGARSCGTPGEYCASQGRELAAVIDISS